MLEAIEWIVWARCRIYQLHWSNPIMIVVDAFFFISDQERL